MPSTRSQRSVGPWRWWLGAPVAPCEDVAIHVDLAVKRSAIELRRTTGVPHERRRRLDRSRREALRGCGLTARLRKICTIYVPTQR